MDRRAESVARGTGCRVSVVFLLSVMTGLMLCAHAEAVVHWTHPADFRGRGGAIGRANLDGSGVIRDLVTGIDPENVAVSATHIYWSESQASGTNTGRIGRARLDGTQVLRNFITRVQPMDLAVHGPHLYWTNMPNFRPDPASSIGRAGLDGKGVQRALIRAPGRIGGIGVDNQHIYWGEFGRMARANLNGTNVRRDFVRYFGTFILRVVSDVEADGTSVYWANPPGAQFGDGIGRVAPDGTNEDPRFLRTSDTVEEVAAAGPASPFAVPHIYWSERRGLFRANRDGTGAQAFVATNHSTSDVAVDSSPTGVPRPGPIAGRRFIAQVVRGAVWSTCPGGAGGVSRASTCLHSDA